MLQTYKSHQYNENEDKSQIQNLNVTYISEYVHASFHQITKHSTIPTTALQLQRRLNALFTGKCYQKQKFK